MFNIKSYILPEQLGLPTSCSLSVSSYLKLFISSPFFVALHVLASMVAGSVSPYALILGFPLFWYNPAPISSFSCLSWQLVPQSNPSTHNPCSVHLLALSSSFYAFFFHITAFHLFFTPLYIFPPTISRDLFTHPQAKGNLLHTTENQIMSLPL